jgi:hypothetical protein
MVVKQIDQITVQGGQVHITGLALPDGAVVQVVVSTVESGKRTIEEVREFVRGSSDPFSDPSEPIIPEDSWEIFIAIRLTESSSRSRDI